ncbi:MAG: hypothetical protein AAF264_05970 [Pseudomonadota bacterium]
MIRIALPLILALSACGVDGRPIPPRDVPVVVPEDVDDDPNTRPIRGGSVLISGNAVAGIRGG